MNKNQRGFGAIEGVVILVIVGLLGGVGWYVFDSNKTNDSLDNAEKSNQVSTAKKSTDSSLYVGWKEYKHKDAKITFKYPITWVSHEDEDYRDEQGFGGASGTVTAPSGKKLEWAYYFVGGKGGFCEPDLNDVPFKAGNKCSSKQILSVEEVGSIEAPKYDDRENRDLFGDKLFITRTKYLSTNGELTYQICLDPYHTIKTEFLDDNTPHPGTEMGLLSPCEYWSAGFNVKFEVNNELEFKSTEAKTAELIMRSFNSF